MTTYMREHLHTSFVELHQLSRDQAHLGIAIGEALLFLQCPHHGTLLVHSFLSGFHFRS